jgi:hypothetical protein
LRKEVKLADEKKEPDHGFPRVKYHQEDGRVTVKSLAEEEALGPGWVNSPADFGKVKSMAEESVEEVIEEPEESEETEEVSVPLRKRKKGR